MPDSTLSTLSQIRTKVRRLTFSPSDSQITDAEIDNYVNTFVLYDVPRHLQLFDLATTFTFYLYNNIDVYESLTTPTTDPRYNFINKYTAFSPPAYVDGREIYFSQSREEFYASFPLTNYNTTIAIGDGVTVAYAGNITSSTGTASVNPILQNQVTIGTIDLNNEAMSAYDLPTDTDQGALLYSTTQAVIGTINYLTGAYTITWPTAPGTAQNIVTHYVSYAAGRPNAVLFYDNQFTFRPVPDQPYRFTINAAIRPSELLSASQQPELAQWWQYIAYGASKKIFEDRSDMESVQKIMPEFETQERLVNRKTIILNRTKRSATMFASQCEQDISINKWPLY